MRHARATLEHAPTDHHPAPVAARSTRSRTCSEATQGPTTPPGPAVFPLGRGSRRAALQRSPPPRLRDATSPHHSPSPRPSPAGPGKARRRGEAEEEARRVAEARGAAPGGARPLSPSFPLAPTGRSGTRNLPRDRPARRGRPRDAACENRQPPLPFAGDGQGGATRGAEGWDGKREEERDGRTEAERAGRGPPPDHRRRHGGGVGAGSDKPLCRGLTFNRSQRGSCSATYETPTQKQVVYEWFSTRFPTNVRCVTGEGAAALSGRAPFPRTKGSPHRTPVPTRDGTRRTRARAAARRRGRRGTGYPRPTEAPAALPYRSAWAGF